MRPLCTIALALLATGARAQIDESGEDPSLPGWGVFDHVTGVEVFTSPQAAHRGDAGIRFTDTETGLVNGGGTHLGRNLVLDGGEVYARLWVRHDQGDGIDGYFDMEWNRSGYSGALAGLNVIAGYSQQLTAQPARTDGGVGFLYAPPGDIFPPADGGWHLVDIGVTGIHAPTTAGTMWFDGVRVAHYDGGVFAALDKQITISLGALYEATSGYTGVIDYDDIRVSTAPLAGHLVTLLGNATQGACSPLSVELRSNVLADDGSEHAPTPAPHEVRVAVSGVQVYGDARCAATATPAIQVGQADVRVFAAVPLQPRVTITVADVDDDFLGGAATFTLADAGTPAGTDAGDETHSYYALQCGSAPGSFALGALALLLRRRRAVSCPSSRTS